MTDKEFNALKKRILKIATWWRAWLGLKWWSLHYTFDREPSEIDRSGKYQVGAYTVVNWEYLDALIVFNMPAMLGRTDEELEDTIVHEFMHIFLNEMREKGHAHEERVATTLANGFIWVRNQAQIEGKKSAKTKNGQSSKI